MNYSPALQFFAFMLALIYLALVFLTMRRDPTPFRSIIRIGRGPHARQSNLSSLVGAVGLLMVYIVLCWPDTLLLLGGWPTNFSE